MDNLLQPLINKNSQSFQQLSKGIGRTKPRSYPASALQHFGEKLNHITTTIAHRNQDGFQQIQNHEHVDQNHLRFIDKIMAKTNQATVDLLSGLNKVKVSQRQISDYEPLSWREMKANQAKGIIASSKDNRQVHQQNQRITAIQSHDKQPQKMSNKIVKETQQKLQVMTEKDVLNESVKSPEINLKDIRKEQDDMALKKGDVSSSHFEEKVKSEKRAGNKKRRNERATQIFGEIFDQIFKSVSSRTQQGFEDIGKVTQSQIKEKVDIVKQVVEKTAGATESLLSGLSQLQISEQELEGQNLVHNSKELQKEHQNLKALTSERITTKSPRYSHLYRINRVSKKQAIKKQMESQIKLKNSIETFKQSSELKDQKHQHLLHGKNILDYVKESKKRKISNLGFKHRVTTIPDAYTAPSAFKNEELHLPNIRQQRKNGQMLPVAAKTQKNDPSSTYS